jgi:sulfite reductase (NADPH) hemoprotein beta-component
VVTPYLFEVRQDKGGVHPVKEREIIRSLGPSIRSDTGKQALHV